MRQVKDLKDVQGGGVFLVKGKEILDPPPGFFARGQPEGGSMKQLTNFQRATAGSSVQLPRTPAVSRSMPFLEAAAGDAAYLAEQGGGGRLPAVGGPPPPGDRSGCSSVRREGGTWGISEWLSWRLSYGGQVGLWSGRHHDYSQWPSLFSSHSSGNLSAMRSTR